MVRILARVAVAAVFAAAAASPIVASAAGGGGGGGSNGMTITIGKPITLQARLLITVPVTVTCVAPITVDPNLSQPGSLGINVEQAVGRNGVAQGAGGVTLTSCSATPQTFMVQVTPISAGSPSLPFHRGTAIAAGGGGICDNNFPQTCYNDGTAWQTVRLV